jgi:hypothetical protein
MRRAVSACRRPPPRGSVARRSAARVVGDREAQGPGGGLVVEVVPRALEPGRADEEPEHGGLVRRVLALLGPVGGDRPWTDVSVAWSAASRLRASGRSCCIFSTVFAVELKYCMSRKPATATIATTMMISMKPKPRCLTEEIVAPSLPRPGKMRRRPGRGPPSATRNGLAPGRARWE